MSKQQRIKLIGGLALAIAIFIVPSAAILQAGSAERPMMSHDFTDVPVPGQEFMEPYINAFYHQGITSGCNVSPLMYCPSNAVTRGSMAVFIGRALGYVDAVNEGINTRAYFKNTTSGYGLVANSNGIGMRSSGLIGFEVYGTNGPAVLAQSTNDFGMMALSSNSSGMFVRSSAAGTDNYAGDTIYDIRLGGNIGEIMADGVMNVAGGGSVWIDLDRNNDDSSFFRIHNGNLNTVFSVDESGNYTATGTKSAIVDTVSHGTRLMYAVESTEVWFEDMGTAQLEDGVIVIEFDPIYAETVNLNEDYQVFLTPVGGWAELYVEEQTATSFTVRATDPDSDLQFHYRIVAKRLGFEDVRMEEVTNP